jgi:hypothetical protein
MCIGSINCKRFILSNDIKMTTDLTRSLARATVFDAVRNSTLFVFNDEVLLWTRSSDDGVTWTAPKAVTIGNYSATRVSPGRGLQLSSSDPVAPGRILFVSQLAINDGDIVYYTVGL